MLKYIANRLMVALVAMFVLASLTFFLMRLVPGDPFAGPKVTPEIAEARGVPAWTECNSPARHSAFDSPAGLLQFGEELVEPRRVVGGGHHLRRDGRSGPQPHREKDAQVTLSERTHAP